MGISEPYQSIHVEGGIITDVFNLPTGYDYVVMDHDCLGDCYPTCEYCIDKLNKTKIGKTDE